VAGGAAATCVGGATGFFAGDALCVAAGLCGVAGGGATATCVGEATGFFACDALCVAAGLCGVAGGASAATCVGDALRVAGRAVDRSLCVRGRGVAGCASTIVVDGARRDFTGVVSTIIVRGRAFPLVT
jgi:hypothetical protein